MKLNLNDLDLTKGLLIGLGVAIVAPVLLPVIGAAVRPVLKSAIKGGFILYKKSREMVAEVVENIEDIAAEAKAEVKS
ncbi:MAG: DUF5132 domain-containing protein [Syntrophobacterales bacterium]|nr:DUF5132 domain-containing protein [Syntrophobacterales bacterium]